MKLTFQTAISSHQVMGMSLMSISHFSFFTEKWLLQKTLTRLYIYIAAWSEITLLVPKCHLIKTAWSNGTWMCTLIWVCLHCLSIRVKRTINIYICSVWSVKCFPDNFGKKKLTKMLLIKSICPNWIHPWLNRNDRLQNEMQQNAT